MGRLTNPYNLVHGSEVPDVTKHWETTGWSEYIVSFWLSGPNPGFSSRLAKQEGTLNHRVRIYKNSGSPERRKSGGDGRIVVPIYSSGLPFGRLLPRNSGKGPSPSRPSERMLSGIPKSGHIHAKLDIIREKAGKNQKVTGLSAVLAEPGFLIAC